MTIEEALRAHEDALMQLPGVQGVGIGESGGDKVIKVFIESEAFEAAGSAANVPPELEGYHVEVEEIGTITPLGADS